MIDDKRRPVAYRGLYQNMKQIHAPGWFLAWGTRMDGSDAYPVAIIEKPDGSVWVADALTVTFMDVGKAGWDSYFVEFMFFICDPYERSDK